MTYNLKCSYLILLLILFVTLPLFADPFTMVSAGDPLLEDLRAVVRSQGKSFLSLTPPLSRDEIFSILDEIDPYSLSEPMRMRYERIFENLFPELRYDNEYFAFAINANAALEGRYRSNKKVPWLKKDNISPAVFSFPIHLFFTSLIDLYFEPMLATDPYYYNNPAASWGTNIPWETVRFDLNIPLRAFAAAGGPWWNFQIGRDKLSFGPGKTGNLAVSDNPDYYDFARLSFFGKNFKYSFLISQMPLSLESRNFWLVDDPASINTNTDLTDTMNRYFYMHRVDIRLFKRLSIGISEGVMAGNASLELRYFNPMMIFHSFFSWMDYPTWQNKEDHHMNGSLLSLDIEWAFLPGWALYGQIIMNEFSTPYEKKNFPDQAPSGMGYLLGAEYVHSVSDWTLSWYTELVYTEPFLYVLSSPFASMIWMRRSSHIGTKELRYDWFGHKDGRDMFLAAAGVFAHAEKITLSADLSVKVQGEHHKRSDGINSIVWDWNKDDSDQRSPSGNPETSVRTLFGLTYKILPALTLSGHLGGTAVFGAGNKRGNREYGIEAGLTAAYSF